jgi:hypothetical protein
MKLAQTATAGVAYLIGQPRPLRRDFRRHGITRRVLVSISHDVQALDVNGSMSKSNRPRPGKALVECPATTPSTVTPLVLVAVQQGSAHRRTTPIRAPAAHVACELIAVSPSESRETPITRVNVAPGRGQAIGSGR